ncbi:MAG TPA: recombinase family protein [Gemmataceae bacterium]|nr:recombinase family protein [Gemmataceae bacterium]
MPTFDLIQPRHLTRRAVIYVRQSSPHQVLTNTESQRLQYAMRRRAYELGWHEQDVLIVDDDTGRTATTTAGRLGFQQLAAQVGLGQIGVIIAYEATRLARNCTHWYQLLDLCGHAGCLIADRDGVYDPGSVNGRLLLGLKGAISELEMHTLRGRLTAGILSKAERGELALALPTGLVRRDDGCVEKHPDQEVRNRIGLVFDTLLEKKSLARVVHHFRGHHLTVPRRDRYGAIQWKRPTIANLGSMVKNPAYAGAFAYGRTRSIRAENTGKMRQRVLPLGQWRILVRDRYPAYVSWQTYERIQQMLRDNHAEYDRNKTRGVPRDGQALLHGIVYCGECGHKLCVQYKGGTRYLCNHLRQQHGEPVCQWLPATPIDEQVMRWFFEALSSASIDLSARTLTEADARRTAIFAARRQQLQRLRYAASRAERQYQQVDPENRLIAAELERRWEAALRELREAEEHLTHDEQQTPVWAIPADLLEALHDIGPRLPELWEQQRLFSSAQKKSLLRSLLDKAVIHRLGGRRGDRIHVRVVWRGGATTTTDLPVSVGRFADRTGAAQMEATILRLAREGRSDTEIAALLTAQGHRSARGATVLPSTVKGIRLRHRVLNRESQSHPRRVAGYLTIPQLAEKLNIPRHWISDRVHNGTIIVEKDTATRCYLFPDNLETLRQFRKLLDGKITEMGCRKEHQDA